MRINITKTEVYDNVAALTALVARMTGDTELVYVSEDNYPALNVYVTSGINELEAELARRLKKGNILKLRDTSSTLTVELDTDKVRMDTSVQNVIVTSVKLYLSHYICSMWLATRESTQTVAEAYKSSAAGFLQSISTALLLREQFLVDEQDYEDRADDAARMDGDTATESTYERRSKEDVQMNGESEGDSTYEKRSEEDERMDEEISTESTYEKRSEEDTQMDAASSGESTYEKRSEDEDHMNSGTSTEGGYDKRSENDARMNDEASSANYGKREEDDARIEGEEEDSGYTLRGEDTFLIDEDDDYFKRNYRKRKHDNAIARPLHHPDECPPHPLFKNYPSIKR
jgi:hypothetical protein